MTKALVNRPPPMRMTWLFIRFCWKRKMPDTTWLELRELHKQLVRLDRSRGHLAIPSIFG